MSDRDIRLENGSSEPTDVDNDAGGTGYVNPGEFRFDAGTGAGSGSPDSGSGPRRRGRKPGSTNKPKANTASVVGIEKILLSTHQMMAAFLSVPELAIDEQEAALIASASAEVAKHYDIVPDPKTQAWINLAMALGAVYGPRAYIIYNKSRQPAQSDPVPFNGGVLAAA